MSGGMAGGNSADRRKARREQARENKRQLRINISFFCAAACVSIVLLFYKKNPVWSGVLLGALWILAWIPIRHMFISDSVVGVSRWLSEFIVVFVVSVIVGSFGVNVWPDPGLGILPLAEQNRFADSIRGSVDSKWPI